jgi:hypothetical protein
MTKKGESFLRYHEQRPEPGEIGLRHVMVSDSVFGSCHAMIIEQCPCCGQEREAVIISQPLAIYSEDGGYFFIDEKVWRATGIKRPLEPGTEIEVGIAVEAIPPSGYMEKVISVKVVK